MFTYWLAAPLPLRRLALRGGDGLALLARICWLSVSLSIRARSQWGLLTVLFDRFFLVVIIRRLVCCHTPDGGGDDCREGTANASNPHEGDRVHRRA